MRGLHVGCPKRMPSRHYAPSFFPPDFSPRPLIGPLSTHQKASFSQTFGAPRLCLSEPSFRNLSARKGSGQDYRKVKMPCRERACSTKGRSCGAHSCAMHAHLTPACLPPRRFVAAFDELNHQALFFLRENRRPPHNLPGGK